MDNYWEREDKIDVIVWRLFDFKLISSRRDIKLFKHILHSLTDKELDRWISKLREVAINKRRRLSDEMQNTKP